MLKMVCPPKSTSTSCRSSGPKNPRSVEQMSTPLLRSALAPARASYTFRSSEPSGCIFHKERHREDLPEKSRPKNRLRTQARENVQQKATKSIKKQRGREGFLKKTTKTSSGRSKQLQPAKKVRRNKVSPRSEEQKSVFFAWGLQHESGMQRASQVVSCQGTHEDKETHPSLRARKNKEKRERCQRGKPKHTRRKLHILDMLLPDQHMAECFHVGRAQVDWRKERISKKGHQSGISKRKRGEKERTTAKIRERESERENRQEKKISLKKEQAQLLERSMVGILTASTSGTPSISSRLVSLPKEARNAWQNCRVSGCLDP